jgi:hypothetical protein
MIIEIEKLDIAKKQLDVQILTTDSVKEEAAALRDMLNTQKEQLDLCKGTVVDLQKIATTQDENCKKLVDAAKPSFWSRVGTHAAAMGVGGILVYVLVLLL